MSELFSLIDKKFSNKYNEWWWTYSVEFEFTFNKLVIKYITITDHYQQEHPTISNELILNILWVKLNGERKEPRKKHGKRDIFVEERIGFQGKKYRLIFWLKDNTNNHLWVRNCHEQN